MCNKGGRHVETRYALSFERERESVRAGGPELLSCMPAYISVTSVLHACFHTSCLRLTVRLMSSLHVANYSTASVPDAIILVEGQCKPALGHNAIAVRDRDAKVIDKRVLSTPGGPRKDTHDRIRPFFRRLRGSRSKRCALRKRGLHPLLPRGGGGDGDVKVHLELW